MDAWVDEWNLIEAMLWFFGGAIFAAKAASAPAKRRCCVLLACAFVGFAVSDLIEMRTGAWWRPWWLAAGKTACLAVLAFGFWKLLQRK